MATVLPGPGAGQPGRDECRVEQDEPDSDGEVPEAAGHVPYAGGLCAKSCVLPMCIFFSLCASVLKRTGVVVVVKQEL